MWLSPSVSFLSTSSKTPTSHWRIKMQSNKCIQSWDSVCSASLALWAATSLVFVLEWNTVISVGDRLLFWIFRKQNRTCATALGGMKRLKSNHSRVARVCDVLDHSLSLPNLYCCISMTEAYEKHWLIISFGSFASFLDTSQEVISQTRPMVRELEQWALQYRYLLVGSGFLEKELESSTLCGIGLLNSKMSLSPLGGFVG